MQIVSVRRHRCPRFTLACAARMLVPFVGRVYAMQRKVGREGERGVGKGRKEGGTGGARATFYGARATFYGARATFYGAWSALLCRPTSDPNTTRTLRKHPQITRRNHTGSHATPPRYTPTLHPPTDDHHPCATPHHP